MSQEATSTVNVLRGRTVLMAWLVTRLLVVIALFGYARRVTGDVNYFRISLDHVGRHGLAHTLVEYPLPAVAAVAAPWLLTHLLASADVLYGLGFLGLALASDGLFLWALRRARTGASSAAVVVWLLAVPALGAVTVTRFDILPGVLVGLMLLVHRRRPALAGGLLAVATCVKLWPALLVVPLVAANASRRRVLLPVVGVGVVTVAASLVLGGWGRLVSPLTYQANRGLQIESVAATPVMLARCVGGRGWQLWFAPSKSWEVTGPGVDVLLILTTFTSLAFLAFLVVTWVRALVHRRLIDTETLVWMVLAATTGFVVLGRVFSPQYLLWVAPPAAAGLLAAGQRWKVLTRWSGWLVVAMALTHLVFPVMYTSLIDRGPGTALAGMVLALRNLVVLALLAISSWESWRLTGLGREPNAVEADAQGGALSDASTERVVR